MRPFFSNILSSVSLCMYPIVLTCHKSPTLQHSIIKPTNSFVEPILLLDSNKLHVILLLVFIPLFALDSLTRCPTPALIATMNRYTLRAQIRLPDPVRE
jgi:hypothetical protein